MATIRRELLFRHPADHVWATIGDPGTVHEWFPGVVASTVDGSTRTITLASGVSLDEEIVTDDPILRRFHLGTIDVIDLGDDSCLVVYSTDAEPDVMALVIGGAGGAGLHELRRQFDAGERDVPSATHLTDGSAA